MSRLTVLLLLLTGTATALMSSSAAGQAAGSRRVGTIAFIQLADDGGPFGGRLYGISADGTGLRPLTPPATRVNWYAWSPDGTLIVYTDQQRSLWLVRPNGTGRRELLPASTQSAVGVSWSPDGKEIAIASAGSDANPNTASCSMNGLYVIPISSGHPTPLPGGRHVGCDLAWSPRGDEIYYDDDGGIWAIHPDGTARRRIFGVGRVGSLSADGAQLAFNVVIHLRNGHSDRYRAFGVVNTDGTKFHVVTTHAYNEYGVAWSPAGHRILYGRANGEGIFVIGSDGRNNQRVTRDSPPGAGWGALAWSPDGHSIVYGAGDDEHSDLYVIGVDGRGKVRLTNTPGIDIDPSWAAR